MKLYERLNAGQTYIIAEMSANHAGKLENALELVRVAKEMGADCLKIQTYTADTITIPCDTEPFKIHGGLWDGYTLYDLYNDAYTPWEWQPLIKAECEKVGIDFLSTPFDPTATDFLEDLGVEFYKIASFELVDIPLIEYVASKGKPIIMSTGMATEQEIEEAVNAVYRQGNRRLVLLKCSSAYPAVPSDMNLRTIPYLKERFGVEAGLSDHSMGSVAAVTAIALGARVIEKHFCLSRKIENPDAAFSMEPDEFKAMVEDIRVAEQAVGNVSFARSEKESANLAFRRSLFAVKDIKAGEVITCENVRSVRPSNGLAPKYYGDILGKTAKTDIAFGTPMSFELINMD